MELSIPTTVNPKPSKKQLIDALVARAEEKYHEAYAVYEAEKEKISQQILTQAMKESSKSNLQPKIIYGERVIFEMASSSAILTSLFKKRDALPEPSFCERQLRERLKNEFVTPYLKRTPEVNASLDAFLSNLSNNSTNYQILP